MHTIELFSFFSMLSFLKNRVRQFRRQANFAVSPLLKKFSKIPFFLHSWISIAPQCINEIILGRLNLRANLSSVTTHARNLESRILLMHTCLSLMWSTTLDVEHNGMHGLISLRSGAIYTWGDRGEGARIAFSTNLTTMAAGCAAMEGMRRRGRNGCMCIHI